MNVFSPTKFKNYSFVMQKLIGTLLTEAKTKSPRGQQVNFIQNCAFTILKPDSVSGTESRPYNWDYALKEIDLYLSGDCSVEKFSEISKFWKQLVNPDNETINSNYGYRILHKPIEAEFYAENKTQWEYCKNQLIKDKDTRQALMFVSGQDVQFDNNKDFICTLTYTFDICEDKLNLTVSRRSQDLFFGLPYDYVWEVYLMHRMLNELKEVYPELKLGTYTLLCNNLHIYERNFEKFKAMLDDYNIGNITEYKIKKELEKANLL